MPAAAGAERPQLAAIKRKRLYRDQRLVQTRCWLRHLPQFDRRLAVGRIDQCEQLRLSRPSRNTDHAPHRPKRESQTPSSLHGVFSFVFYLQFEVAVPTGKGGRGGTPLPWSTWRCGLAVVTWGVAEDCVG